MQSEDTPAFSPNNVEFFKQRIQQLENKIDELKTKKRAIPKKKTLELARMRALLEKMSSPTPDPSIERKALTVLEENEVRTIITRSTKVAIPSRPPHAPRRKSQQPDPPYPTCEKDGALRIGKNVYQPYHFREWTDPNGLKHLVYIPFCMPDPLNCPDDPTAFKWYFRVVFMIPEVFGVYHGQLTDACFRTVPTLWNKIEAFQRHAWFAKVSPSFGLFFSRSDALSRQAPRQSRLWFPSPSPPTCATSRCRWTTCSTRAIPSRSCRPA